MREDSKCICLINNKHMDQRLEICNRSNGYVLQKYHSNSTSLDHMLRLPQNTYPLLWASPNNAPTIYANHVATPLRRACGRRAMYAHHCRTINKSLSSWQGWQSGGNKWDQFCQIRIARNSLLIHLSLSNNRHNGHNDLMHGWLHGFKFHVATSENATNMKYLKRTHVHHLPSSMFIYLTMIYIKVQVDVSKLLMIYVLYKPGTICLTQGSLDLKVAWIPLLALQGKKSACHNDAWMMRRIS